MIRVLNFFCVALVGLSCLALYHVSEQTRVARMQLSQVNRQIAQDTQHHQRAAKPNGSRSPIPPASSNWRSRNWALTMPRSVQLASFELLPRRGEDTAPLNNSPVRNANAVMPAKPYPNSRAAAARIGM